MTRWRLDWRGGAPLSGAASFIREVVRSFKANTGRGFTRACITGILSCLAGQVLKDN